MELYLSVDLSKYWPTANRSQSTILQGVTVMFNIIVPVYALNFVLFTIAAILGLI